MATLPNILLIIVLQVQLMIMLQILYLKSYDNAQYRGAFFADRAALDGGATSRNTSSWPSLDAKKAPTPGASNQKTVSDAAAAAADHKVDDGNQTPHVQPTNNTNTDDYSRSATVIGIAMGYDLTVLNGFIGSLRKSGFLGHIILGVAENVSPKVLAYFRFRNVTHKVLVRANCTHHPWFDGNETAMAERKIQSPDAYGDLSYCVGPYTNIKSRWVKYPLARDWLLDCKTCTGPVLLTDIRDAYFQTNPFGPNLPKIEGLQVFEEHRDITTEHWLVSWPTGECKNVTFKKPMLCSGSTVGTREAMMDYLNVIYDEMQVWISTDKCRFFTVGDDQSIHNWLFYTGKIANAVAIPIREGIVNTIGHEASLIFEAHIANGLAQNFTESYARHVMDLKGATSKSWIGPEYGLTDEDGFFTNKDGSRSPMVHQFDRLGLIAFDRWRIKQDELQD